MKNIKNKELITIALAVYNPNEQWLRKLLGSLNRQTYQNLELLVCDDASEDDKFLKLSKIITECITNFPYHILRNHKNVGCNQTFLRLILESSGKYIAFCDQDDIWLENKIEYLYHAIKIENAVLSYCDMQVIDKNDKRISNSLKNKRKRLVYIKGENLIKDYIFHNCTAGCSMLLDKSCALKAENVPEGTYWDHWLCILASIQGRIAFVNMPLVYYRIHGKNQSGILAGIKNWEDYYEERIIGLYRRVKILHEKGYHYLYQKEIEAITCARKNREIRMMWKYRYLCRKEVYFEILIPKMPRSIFRLAKLILCRG